MACRAGPVQAQSLPASSPLAQAATDFLQNAAIDAGLDGTLQVSFTDAGGERMRDCAAPHLTRSSDRPLGVYETLQVSCPGDPALPGITYLRAQLSLPGAYVVAARPIDRGQVITNGDLATRHGDLLRLPPDARAPRADWLGMIATQRLAANRPLRGSSVRSGASVARGQQVRLVYRSPGLSVTNTGEAMGPADVGTTVEVKTGSGRIVSGRVAPDGTVRINP